MISYLLRTKINKQKIIMQKLKMMRRKKNLRIN